MKIRHLRETFLEIEFPEYQREPNIWSRDQKQRLIDSIVREFDIASVYLYMRDDGGLECIDGRQRLNAIMSFLGGNPLDESDNNFQLRMHNEIAASLESPYGAFDGYTFREIEALDDPLASAAVTAVLEY